MNWENIYRRKVTDVSTALSYIKSGNRLYVGGGAGVPVKLTQALTQKAPELRDVELTHILTFAEAPYVAPEYSDSFRVNALFIGANVRKAVADGRADFTPHLPLRDSGAVSQRHFAHRCGPDLRFTAG